jgi:hypothetical protein
MKTGGTRPDGEPTGIHWHIHSGVEVRYRASDESRREIPWIRLVDRRTGREEVFTLPGVDPANPPPGPERVMDCVDCHNQPSHIFHRETEEIDRSIDLGLLSRDLPYIRKVGLEALRASWTQAGAEAGIRGMLSEFYAAKEPVPAEKRPLVEAAAKEIHAIWARNNYPHMKIAWNTYESFAGHAGCLRCHDDDHVSASGRRIPLDCESCHAILAYRTPDLPPYLR